MMAFIEQEANEKAEEIDAKVRLLLLLFFLNTRFLLVALTILELALSVEQAELPGTPASASGCWN